MAHINIIIPDDLHKRLKYAALEADTTAKNLIITLLSEKRGKH